MLEKALRLLLCALCLAGSASVASAQTKAVVPWPKPDLRGWILLNYDMDYLRDVIRRCPKYGINHVQISHDIVHHADEVITDETKRRDVNELVALAHSVGAEAFVWTHEIRQPEPWMIKDGRVVITSEKFWDWIRERYERFWELCPEVDGLVISFSEGDYSIDSPGEVASPMPKEELYRELIDAVYQPCRRNGKTLMVRKFSDAALPTILAAPEDLVVMQKCTTSDWAVYSAGNETLGKYGNHKLICEFDLAGEYVGQGELPWCAPAYIQGRFRYALGRGCTGVVGRIDRGSRVSFGAPNQINIDVFSALCDDPDLDVEAFWHDWAARRFGEKAAAAAVAVLQPTFELTTRLFWGDRIYDWRIQQHSRIPTLSYARSHDRVYYFTPPTDVALFAVEGMLDSEMQRRYGSLRTDVGRVMSRLEKSRGLFSDEDYAWLRRYLRRLALSVDAFRAAHTAYLRLRVIEEAGPTPARLAAIKSDLAAMRRVAGEIDEAIRPPMELVNGSRLRNLAGEIEQALDGVR